MHISFVMSSLQLSGGVQVVVEYANRMAERGNTVSLVTPRHSIDPEIAGRVSSAVEIREIKLALKPQMKAFYQIRLALSLAHAIPRSDVIIATHTPTIVPVILRTLRQPGDRVWLYMDYQEMFRGRPIEKWLLQHGPRKFDKILTLSESGCQDALSTGAKQVVVVGLGLTDSELFIPDKVEHRQDAGRVIMYLGDARPRKGLALFLEAASLVGQTIQDLRLLVIAKQILTVNSSLPTELVVKPLRAALPALYRRSAVFVFTSWEEGFGLPPLEAMACGVPVVLTDSRGVREYARPYENCLMVQPRDTQGLAAAILSILSNKRLASQLAENGVKTAARFQWAQCVDRFETALRSRT